MVKKVLGFLFHLFINAIFALSFVDKLGWYWHNDPARVIVAVVVLLSASVGWWMSGYDKEVLKEMEKSALFNVVALSLPMLLFMLVAWLMSAGWLGQLFTF